MRASFAVCLLVMGCGKQLNPDWCMAHEGDPDCAAQGLVFIDAAGPCQTNSECTDPGKTVCDLAIHACVQCAGADKAACTGTATVCNASDTCVECVTNADCTTTSGVCLTSSNTCAPSDSILHVTPDGATTGTCPEAQKCALDYALTVVDATHHVLSLDDGQYNMTATLSLGKDGLHLVPAVAGTMPKITNVTGGKVFAVTASAELDSLEIQGASDAIVTCQNTTLVVESSFLHGTSKDAINSNNCALTVERSRIAAAGESGFYVTDGQVHLRNNFIFGNGSTSYGDAAISFNGNVSGSAEYNTVAYNTAGTYKKLENGHLVDAPYPAGINCANTDGGVTLNGNLFVEDNGETYSVNTFFNFKACTTDFTVANMIASAGDAAFVSTSDLHLTTATKSGNGKVRDVGNISCANLAVDIDGDARPQNAACDYGADELKSN